MGDPSGHHDWNSKFARGNMFVAECRREWVAVFTAGLNNFAGKTLCDFNGLGEAPSFRYQSRYVRARAQVAPAFYGLHSDANGHFFYIRQMHLSFQNNLPNAQQL